MSSAPSQLALFIDADNFRDCDALKQAMQKVFTEGEPVLKHAYGDAVSLKNLEALLAEYGIRPVCNVSVSKNTTDVALAIAAMEAVCRNPAIKTVVICSGDADFAPLAMRLRELGCKMVCYGIEHILFKTAEKFYDEVVGIDVVLEGAEPDAAPALAAMQQPAPTAPTARMPSKEEVLQAWPNLRTGQWQPLSQVIGSLRKKGVLGQTVPLRQWAEPLGAAFELQPSATPNQIRYRLLQKTLATPSSPSPLSQAQSLTAQKILRAWPDLKDGQWHPLSKVVHALRQQGALAKSSKFKQWSAVLASAFEWQPAQAPHALRYRLAAQAQPIAAAQNAPQQPEPAGDTVLAWPVLAKRRNMPPLPAEKHRLRQVLLQLAARRISVADVLLAAPALVKGRWCAYTAVAGSLREKGLLHPGASLLWVVQDKPEKWQIQCNAAGQPQALRYCDAVR